jgi:hypothetical protein
LWNAIKYSDEAVKRRKNYECPFIILLRCLSLYLHVLTILFCRTTRNPHSVDRYTCGSSSGPAALVWLCSVTIGADGVGLYS